MLHAAWMDSFILLDSSGDGAGTRSRHMGPPESGFRRRDGAEIRLSCILSTHSSEVADGPLFAAALPNRAWPGNKSNHVIGVRI